MIEFLFGIAMGGVPAGGATWCLTKNLWASIFLGEFAAFLITLMLIIAREIRADRKAIH